MEQPPQQPTQEKLQETPEQRELREMREEITRLREEKRLLEEKNKHLEKENIRIEEERALFEKAVLEEKVDWTMGLRKRPDFYNNLRRSIEATLGDDFKELEKADTLEKRLSILEKIEGRSKDLGLYALAGDVSFLSYANEESHAAGDELLQSLGRSAKEVGSPEINKETIIDTLKGKPTSVEFELYRTGGDEVSAIMIGSSQTSVLDKITTIKETFANKEIDALKKVGLEPGIDIGFAHISEAIRAYKELVKNKDREGLGTGDNAMHDLLNIMNGIADRRSLIQKGIERINLLIEVKNSEPEKYEEIIGFLRKGAFNLPDIEIDKFVRESDKFGDDKKGWRKYLLEKVRELTNKKIEKEERIKELEVAAIREVADGFFFTEE